MPCAAEAYQAADRELNETYKHLLSALDIPSQKRLVQAERAWLAFVDAESKFIFEIEGDGSSGRLAVTNSREKHARNRTNELKNWDVR